MNKSDLINALKDRAGLSRKESETVVDTMFGDIAETMAADHRVEIRGFGSFSVKHYRAYTGRNPKTGTRIDVPAKKLPFFKVGKELKDKVDEGE